MEPQRFLAFWAGGKAETGNGKRSLGIKTRLTGLFLLSSGVGESRVELWNGKGMETNTKIHATSMVKV
jgi:hypothetical protein